MRKVLLGAALLASCAVPALGALPAQWRNVSPEGGWVSIVAVDGDDPHHALALSIGGKIFETQDRGGTWRESGTSPCGATRLQYHSGAFYTACGGIWRTRDGGAHWEKFSQKTQPADVGAHALDFSSRPGEAIAWGSGARVTSDDGKNWIDVAGPFDMYTGAVVPGTRRAIALHSDERGWRVLESADLGGSWAPSSEPVECPYATFCPTAIAIDAAGTLYVNGAAGVYVRREGAGAFRLWTRQEMGLAGGDTQVVVDPRGRALAYTDTTAALSSDGGLSWASFSLPAAAVNDAELANDGSVWVATRQGVWRREGGGTWARSTLGLRAESASVVLWTGTDAASLLAYTFDSGWSRSDDDGKTWTAVTLPGGPIRIPGSNELWFVGASAGRTALYRSRDAGSTFELVNAAIATAKGDVSDAIPAGPDARVWYGRFLRYTSPGFETYGLAVSRDGGRSWSDMTSLAASSSSRIIPSPVSPSLAFASNSAGWHRTQDAGETWSLVSPASQGFASLVPDAVDASTVYGYSEAGFWVSRDAGSTWSRATLPDAHFLATVAADPWDAGRVYAQAADGAILQSRDRGGRWERLVLHGPAPFYTGAPLAIRRDGTARVFANAGSGVHVARADASTLTLGSDLWWNPAEPGMGLTITQHESGQVFVVWYAYDEQRRPTWYVVPGGDWDGTTFTGAMYRTTGTPLGRAFDPGRASLERVGSLTLAFEGPDSARMAYAFDGGARGEKRIQRQLFGPPSRATDLDRADLWWNAQEPGSGVAISHQYDKVFLTWYTYDAAGRPQWIVLPDGVRIFSFNDGLYEGALYIADGPMASVRQVGTARLRFVRDEAWLEYTLSGLFGQTVQLRLTRQPF